MTSDNTLLDALIESLHTAARGYNPNDAVAPVAVLWPDKERQWEPLLPELRKRLPLLTLGQFDPDSYRGPAYWIRCVVDRALPDDRLVDGAVPVVYLPGVSRPDLRAVESCPEPIQPLSELQYRGVIWSHKNGKDWTVSAFLHSTEGGLGLPLDGSASTREALRLALCPLAVTPVSQLRTVTVIDEAYLLGILNPDVVSQLLRWLNDPAAQQAAMTGDRWSGFRQHCRKQYGFDPEKDGPLTAAHKLGERKGAWRAIWNRYSEAADNFPGITSQLRKASPPYTPRLLEPAAPWPGRDDPQSSWPALNEGLEAELRAALIQLRGASLDEARERVLALDTIHGNRREWLWSRLGLSPLATALRALTRLAGAGEAVLPGMTVNELATSYAANGWEIDAAAVDALLAVRTASLDDLQAVQVAIEALYRPWLSEQALRFQSLAVTLGEYQVPTAPQVEPGTVVVFCDGLRFDIGQRLADAVTARGLSAQIGHRLAALPTLTPTAKPAVMPFGVALEPGLEFGVRAPGAQGNLLADGGRKLLSAAGFQILLGDNLGDPMGRAWIELGAIDSNGHANGWKVAYHAVEEMRDLAERIAKLLAWGWRRVVVVTDHGWLMLPESLPKVELPASLTEPRKGRCARIKPGSQVDFPVLPWHWDSSVRIAMAPGISCFTAGATYDHGGLSLQECVTPVITVSAAIDAGRAVDVMRVTWRNLRCNATVSGASPEMVIDLRRQAADSGSSVANSTKHPDPDGTAALFIDDAELTGDEVQLVVLSADGTILAQRATTVGG